jgi:hypothetical protein
MNNIKGNYNCKSCTSEKITGKTTVGHMRASDFTIEGAIPQLELEGGSLFRE